jgi:putative transposase
VPAIARSHRGAPPPTLLQDTLLELYPSVLLTRLAEESGFIRRYRKVDPVAFFWAVTLEAGVYLQRSLDQLRHVYNERAAKPLHSYASFYDRFTPELVEFLHLCVAHGLSQLKAAPGNRLSPKLAAFEDVLIQDSTIVRLSASLATHYPPVRASLPTAGAKIATLVSIRSNGPKRVDLIPESVSERDTLKPGPWVKGSILLFDLGFYKYQAFARIEENGGFYLTRMPSTVNPTIVRSLRVQEGRAMELDGRTWKEVLPHLHRQILDLEVEFAFHRRRYAGSRRGDLLTARMVAVWNVETRKYHTYLTNIGPEVLTAEEVAQLYGCRWEIELVFKELKGQYALDRVNTTNRAVAEAMIWASLLTLIISRRLHSEIRSRLSEEVRARYPPIRWGIAFREQSGKILELLMERLERKHVDPEPMLELARTLMARALDPNAGRERFRAEWWG